MKRRDLLKLSGMALAQSGTARFSLLAQTGMATTPSNALTEAKADYSLRIAPVTVELDRSHILSTIGYNGTAPGPVLRMKEGKSVTVDVINDTDTPEFVHWHGMLIPAELDGTEEEGSPFVPPHGRRRFQLTPGPAGSRRYHSHAMAMDNLHKGSYTGQFVLDSGDTAEIIDVGPLPDDAEISVPVPEGVHDLQAKDAMVQQGGAASG